MIWATLVASKKVAVSGAAATVDQTIPATGNGLAEISGSAVRHAGTSFGLRPPILSSHELDSLWQGTQTFRCRSFLRISGQLHSRSARQGSVPGREKQEIGECDKDRDDEDGEHELDHAPAGLYLGIAHASVTIDQTKGCARKEKRRAHPAKAELASVVISPCGLSILTYAFVH